MYYLRVRNSHRAHARDRLYLSPIHDPCFGHGEHELTNNNHHSSSSSALLPSSPTTAMNRNIHHHSNSIIRCR